MPNKPLKKSITVPSRRLSNLYMLHAIEVQRSSSTPSQGSNYGQTPPHHALADHISRLLTYQHIEEEGDGKRKAVGTEIIQDQENHNKMEQNHFHPALPIKSKPSIYIQR